MTALKASCTSGDATSATREERAAGGAWRARRSGGGCSAKLSGESRSVAKDMSKGWLG